MNAYFIFEWYAVCVPAPCASQLGAYTMEFLQPHQLPHSFIYSSIRLLSLVFLVTDAVNAWRSYVSHICIDAQKHCPFCHTINNNQFSIRSFLPCLLNAMGCRHFLYLFFTLYKIHTYTKCVVAALFAPTFDWCEGNSYANRSVNPWEMSNL